MGRLRETAEGVCHDAAWGCAPGVLLHLLPRLLHQAVQARPHREEVAAQPSLKLVSRQPSLEIT